MHLARELNKFLGAFSMIYDTPNTLDDNVNRL